MENKTKIKLFLVDDDILFLKSIEIEFLDQGDFLIETYSTGEACIAHLSHDPDVILLDYHLNGIDKNAMNGIETLSKIKTLKPDIAVILLSADSTVELAVDCMYNKAFDYLVKSEVTFMRLKKIISSISAFQKIKLKTL